ncbi:lipoprotein [Mesoplasma coleopterae]|uniref:lipoprotein n=1 Tax=Mesoplasma coleopterae TaxID=324078 RepID=UPI000D02A2BD|nr:lipoprotein [Mesoplasma coleopterae]AVN62066.1 hypothetical protein CG001_00115 [Mesoplasma coleopterae]AVN62728.1 hypothetical protein CG000_00150 [Mesoplasma coleopterae]
MRKILAILAAVGLTATTGTTLVSCGTNNKIDYTKVEGVNSYFNNKNVMQLQGYIITNIGTNFKDKDELNSKLATIDYTAIASKTLIFSPNLQLGKTSKESLDSIKNDPTNLEDNAIYVCAIRSSTVGTDKKPTFKIEYYNTYKGKWTQGKFGFQYDNVFVTYTN